MHPSHSHSAVQDMPTATPSPTPASEPPEMTPEIQEMLRKLKRGGFGGQKIEKIKRRLEKRGYDMSRINTNSLSGFESLDDTMIENLLIQMSKGGFGEGAPPAAAAKGAGSGVYDTAPDSYEGGGAGGADDVAEVTDDEL
jgi:hypothetical protein